jgi:hypothetical protein
MPNHFGDLDKIIEPKALRKSRYLLRKNREISEISQIITRTIQSGGEENLIILLRRHWINLFAQLFPFLALIFILFFAYLFFYLFLGPHLLAPIEMEFVHLATSLFILFLWSFIFVVFIDYYLDVWIVTNERIVNIEQKGLFRREISELRLENVQDLTTDIGGMVKTFFDFGDLYVQTAGKRERFLFKSIPHPERVRDIILVLSDGKKKNNI